MNWESIFTQIILGIVGIVISAVGAYVSYWISTKIKDDKLRRVVSSFNDLVRKAVLIVYQTYVEGLKCAGKFGEEEQRIALSKALEIIKKEMTPDVENWLKETQTDLTGYIKSMIEAQIALQKK